ncbi:MAG: aldehyde dehydrogenase [Bradyrhizobium sp. PARBB1]|nr:MAG: aldehyde dehydrogenase [Bradyrhizobium sp. PARBB1]
MSKANRLDRRAVVAELLRDRKGAFAVGGLGASTYDIAAAGDHDRNFYLWGGMGGAVMIGLGLALAQPTLPVVALQQPKNLSIIVLDNEAYGETGGQASHTGGTADLVGVAKACGIGDSRSISTMAEVETFASSLQDVTAGPRFASAKIDGANLERVLSSRDGTYIVNRIRGSIGHSPI